ncbi:MAG: hypothetical protein JWN70_815, partial [Planctomycetaceae bacterium]|nr:hypothetical protein [Planctomycetaceae bacterium]
MTRVLTGLIVATLAVLVPATAFALLIGDEGNKPVRDPGWPKGAAVIFNHASR